MEEHKEMSGASADADRAGHEPSQQAVSAVGSIPSAALEGAARAIAAVRRGLLPTDSPIDKVWHSYVGQARAAVLEYSSLPALVATIPDGWSWVLRSGKDGEEGRFFARIATPDFKSVTWGRDELWITDHISGSEYRTWAETPETALETVLAQAIEARRTETRSGSVEDESAVRQDAPE